MIRVLAALLCMVSACAHAQAVIQSNNLPTVNQANAPSMLCNYALVTYDATTGTVIEIVVPSSDAEGAAMFNLTTRPVPNAVQVRVPLSAIKALGMQAALAQVAPSAVLSGDPTAIVLQAAQ